MKEPKTYRRRGVIFSTIRRLASKRKQFKLRDLMPPLTLEQAHHNVTRLIERGELVRVKAAVKMGNWWLHAVYKRTESLRKAELTNKHL